MQRCSRAHFKRNIYDRFTTLFATLGRKYGRKQVANVANRSEIHSKTVSAVLASTFRDFHAVYIHSEDTYQWYIARFHFRLQAAKLLKFVIQQCQTTLPYPIRLWCCLRLTLCWVFVINPDSPAVHSVPYTSIIGSRNRITFIKHLYYYLDMLLSSSRVENIPTPWIHRCLLTSSSARFLLLPHPFL